MHFVPNWSSTSKVHSGHGSSTSAQDRGYGKHNAGKITWSPSWLRVAPNRAGRSAKSILALCSEVCREKWPCLPSVRNPLPSAPSPCLPFRLTARMSPRMGVAPHRTVTTTTGSGKAAGCMAAGGESRGGSVLVAGAEADSAPSLPLLQDPRGPVTPRSHLSATWGRRGRNPDFGSYTTRLMRLGETLKNVRFPGVEKKRRKGTDANTGDRKTSEGWGCAEVGLPARWASS